MCECVYLTERERLYAGVQTCESRSTDKAVHMVGQEAAGFDVREAEFRGKRGEG